MNQIMQENLVEDEYDDVNQVVKELVESWKFGLVICNDRLSEKYGCIVKLYEF
ncbi:MAG: hypothetical protein WBV92_02085 [Nitrosotalea sp.]